MKKTVSGILFILFIAAPICLYAQSNWISLGYGFALFSEPGEIGKIEEGSYDYVQFAYAHERALSERLGVLIEPFVAYVVRPVQGVDVGFTVSLKHSFKQRGDNGFFLPLGGGSAYTSVNFKEQGTHLLFILQAGIGYRWKEFFIENRLRHYSNASTAQPNRSINSNTVIMGMNF